MEPLFNIQLRHATDSQVTLALSSEPDQYGAPYFVVKSITPGRVLQEYQKSIVKHAPEIAAEFTAFNDYETYSTFVNGLTKSGYTSDFKHKVKQSFSHMKVYLQWHNSPHSLQGHFEGAEIIFRLPQYLDGWVFKDVVAEAKVMFTY